MKRNAIAARSRRRILGRTGVIAAAVLAGASVGAQPVQAAPAKPNFGALIDAYQSYVGQSSCNPTAKAGVVEFKDLVLAAYPNTSSSGISRACDVGGTSEHKEGRAWDWRVSAATQMGTANDLLNWLLATDKYGNQHALARRFGIMYIIWNSQMWRAYNPGAGWQPISCSGVTDCHQDHVHFSFGWSGANKQTSWWSGGSHGKQTVGYYNPSNAAYTLTNSANGGSVDANFAFGPTGRIPIAGDWNADGKTTVGYYQPSTGSWYLRNSNSAGAADISFTYGPPNMVPVVGDWNNDGKTTVGYYRPSDGTWHLRNSNSGGSPDASFAYGPANMKPVAGDWNNDGKTTVGYYRPSDATWNLRNSNSAGSSDHTFAFGPTNMVPVAGDWNADGKTTVGYYQPSNGSWHLKDSHSGGSSDHVYVFGPPNMKPIVGDWNRA